MNSKPNQCDRKRIDLFLRSDQIQTADEELCFHLDNCRECREYIERQAADAESWSQAGRSLQEVEFDMPQSIDCSASAIDLSQVCDTRAIQAVLESLIPSEDPHRLGRLDGYEITGVVGAGAMGVVLKAIDPALDRIVALKVMAPHLAFHGSARKRFEREAKAAAAVLHPNVIPIYAVSSGGAMPYLVMAYIRGGSLQKRIDREGTLQIGEILRIGSQIAAGLAAAHDQGLVHRDIKPENIMLEEGIERVTLTDFGLARSVDDASITQDGTIAGTPQFMSPEQALGEPVEQASDLFSLGSVLYTLCTGRVPFRAESSHSVMRKIIDEEPVPIRELNPDVPEWLCDIVAKLMAKGKAARFSSAKNVHALLENCLSHVQQPTVIKLPEAVRELSPSKSNSSFRVILSVIAITVFAIFTFWWKGGQGFLFQRQVTQQSTTELQESVAVSPDKSEPLTWQKVLGEDAPAKYPSEPLRAIDGLNNAVGSWKFAGQQIQDGEKYSFEANLLVQGGVNRDSFSLGGQPMWQITIEWPVKKPDHFLTLTIVPTFNPTGVDWLLFCGSSFKAISTDTIEKQFYVGSWDEPTRTFTWTPNTPLLPNTTAGGGAKFQILIGKNGRLQIDGLVPSGSTPISGRSATRIGEYVKPNGLIKSLPNGYRLFFASSSDVNLVDKENMVVAGPRIDKIGCSEKLIFGLISPMERAENRGDISGYFWLDTTSGQNKKGLNLHEWQEVLTANGVDDVSLHAPERVGPRS